MSDKMEKLLVQLVKTQLKKKSSKKSKDKPSVEKHALSEEEIVKEENKARIVLEKMELCSKVSEEEKWKIYRQLILENITKFLFILLYCSVALIAIFKFGIMLLTLIQTFIHGLFVTDLAK